MARPTRRAFLELLAGLGFASLACPTRAGEASESREKAMRRAGAQQSLTLFLCGDVMTGRGLDQVLPHPGDPRLHEPFVRDARDYVALAERLNGPIAAPVDFAYPWGDALDELAARAPDARIVNLETAATRSSEPWPGKAIHYRMHPANVPCLTAAGIDCCVLSNNHVLDWGYGGLAETLAALRSAGIRTAGAGNDVLEAATPAALDIDGKGRVLVFAFGDRSSGIPRSWAAAAGRAGLNLLPDFSDATVKTIAARIRALRRPRDVAIASIHWGPNWGYEVHPDHRRFAHRLIEAAKVDIVHGHSSHHPKGIEVFRGRLILFGCGDFLNDYEGIGGYEAYRGELTLMYFPSLDPGSGELRHLALVPLRMRRFRLERAGAEEAQWLARTLTREGRAYGTRVEMDGDGTLSVRWN